MTKNTYPVLTTPIGRAKYVWLNKPDTKFGQEKYKTQLLMDPDQAQPVVKALQAAAVAQFGDRASEAKLGFTTDVDTGEIDLKTATKYEPKFFDSQGHPIPKASLPELFGGSRLALRIKLYPYDVNATNYGITCQIMAVQIVEALTSSDNMEGAGFDRVDGGFVAEDTSFSTAGVTPASDDSFGEASYLD
jgi:hypothetical protein